MARNALRNELVIANMHRKMPNIGLPDVILVSGGPGGGGSPPPLVPRPKAEAASAAGARTPEIRAKEVNMPHMSIILGVG